MKQLMKPEQTRRERFTAYAHMLKERFHSGMLSQLQGLPQWVVWRGELEEGKSKKVPYNPNHRFARASIKIPKSWGTLDQALTALESGNYSGIGFVITPPLVMIDLDHSYDRSTQTITDPKAAEIVQSLNSYTEQSPSRTGLHILAYADKPIKSLHKEIEMYGQDRFTTITTDHLPGTPLTIENRTDAIQALYRQFAPVEQIPSKNTSGGVVAVPLWTRAREIAELTIADEQVLQEALNDPHSNFTRYWNADPTLLIPKAPDMKPERKSDSEVFFVLVAMLLTRTGDNEKQAIRLYYKSPFAATYPKAMKIIGRDKETDRPVTYLESTIRNAMRKRRNPPQRR